jgi:protocatechuate 3,4-dioxygenase beta subunit
MRKITSLILLLLALPLAAIDREFLRAWESAQRSRPATVTTTGRIAPPSDPGVPLTIHGRVVTSAGAPVVNGIVFAWQTDASGQYDRRGTPAHSWRLRGWARTDDRGTFTFHTIRPAAYPDHREPAHVHFSLELTDGRRYFTRDLNFADDPLVKRSTDAVAVTTRQGRQHVSIVLSLDPANRF